MHSSLAAATGGGLFGPVVRSWVVFVVVLVVVGGGMRLAGHLLWGRGMSLERRLPRQLSLAFLALVGVITVILTLPGGEAGAVSSATRGQLLSLVGLGVTAVITLSSTTLAANAMAGLMLRATAPFRGGDWVRVQDHFGRVTQRGLFHTEIQTEDKDLLSLPNLLLATNPVRIVQRKGTIVSAEVSLGYGVSHSRASVLLREAAAAVGLEEPFVWITALNDHTVAYRIAGHLEDVTGLISVRSKLRASVLDTLHQAGIEIASPSLMIQRPEGRGPAEIPAVPSEGIDHDEPLAEEIVFDKADEAARIEKLGARKSKLEEELKGLDSDEDSEHDAARLKRQIAALERAIEWARARSEREAEDD